MATREEIIARAKEIIEVYPTAGKKRVNQYLRMEYGVGLRSEAILKIKREVGSERPELSPALYGRGGVPKELKSIYMGWREAGFLPFEAREFTVGHGARYRAFDAQAVFDSAPGVAARRTRMEWVQQRLADGWTRKEIRDAIVDYYRKSKEVDPWEHIRAEYKPPKKIDYIEYREKIRKRAKARQRRLLKRRLLE